MHSQQPWLHDVEIAVDGSSCVVGARDGNLYGVGAQGFLVDDARVLSRLIIRVNDLDVTAISSRSRGNESAFVGSLRGLGDAGPDPTVEVRRRRVVQGRVLRETVDLVSRAREDVDVTVTVDFAADGAELPALKGGYGASPVPIESSASVARWSAARHTVLARVSPSTPVVPFGEGARWSWTLTLSQGECAKVALEVEASEVVSGNFTADAGAAQVLWSAEGLGTADCADPRLRRAVEASVADLRHLLLTEPNHPGEVFAAAGAPWYLTLFGRDSLWSARLALPLGVDLAEGTLRALARRQGVRHNLATAEAPGKIPHELRRTEFVDRMAGFVLPPIYWGTVDATPLWITLLHEAWRAGMSHEKTHDLLGPLRAALDWLFAESDNGTKPLRYIDESGTGLTNQGWKDSGDSIRWQDGRVASAPIALIEAQAYAVEAGYAAAQLLREVSSEREDQALAARAEAMANGLKEFVRRRFWVEGDVGRYLAMALDGEGKPVDGIGSNMGHALGTGLLDDSEAAKVAAMLRHPMLLGHYGIRTLATTNAGFNPIGYHTGSVWTHDTAICLRGLAKEGFHEQARDGARRLLDVAEWFDYRVPELFGDDGPLGAPIPYPASCRPQAWSAASMVLVRDLLTAE